MSATSGLGRRLRGLTSRGVLSVGVGLRGLSCVSSANLNTVVNILGGLGASGGRVCVVGPGDGMGGVFAVANLSGVFGIRK